MFVMDNSEWFERLGDWTDGGIQEREVLVGCSENENICKWGGGGSVLKAIVLVDGPGDGDSEEVGTGTEVPETWRSTDGARR